MSLVDRANELEYVPEEQLIQMSQSPEGQYPQFLVLSEIQRRNQMRRMYENQTAKMNQPTTTVAEESVMELAGQGAVPMMDSLSSLSSSEGGLRSMAPTPMKSGKKTTVMTAEEMFNNLPESFKKGYKVENVDGRKYVIPEFRNADDVRNLNVDLITPEGFINSVRNKMNKLKSRVDEVDSFSYKTSRGLADAVNSIGGIFYPNTYKRYLESTQPNRIYSQVSSEDRELLKEYYGEDQKQKGGITQMQSGRSTALEQSFDNPLDQEGSNSFLDSLRERYVNPDGTFNTSQIAKDGLSTALVASYFTPAGAIRGGLGLLGRGAMSLFKPFTAAGREGIKRSVGRQAAKINPKMVRDPKTGKFRSQAEIGGKAITSVAKPVGLVAGVGITQAPGEDTSITNQDDVEITDAEKSAASSLEDLQKLLDKPTDTTTTEKQGFGSDDFLTLAQLGGILGGATNLGEAAMGIGNLAGQIQKTRRESGLEGAQRSLLEAQTAKYIADVANMDLDNALQQYSAIPKLVESGVLTPEEAKIREAALIQRINEFQGTATNTSQKSYSQFVS